MGSSLRASLLLFGTALSALALTACATGVTFETGGAGGSTNTSAGGGGATGGGGGATTSSTTPTDGTCVGEADCVAFGDACNAGACINGMCGKLPSTNGAPCEDGKQCTQNDTCQQGICVGGPLKSCSSGNPCMVGTCDLATDSCKEVPGNDGAFCNIGSPCILTAKCLSGVCQPNQMKDCSFLNTICGDGFCNAQGNCEAQPKNDGTACNDGLFCTINDQCVSGQCKGMPNPCGAPNNPCMIAVCNENFQTCQATPGNNGAACSDGNFCTSGETCSNGTCVGGVAANNGQACDDSNGCTGGTTCSNGVCTNAQTQIVQCVDNDSCCPAGCAGDKDCLWYVSGVQQNVAPSQLTGWTQCYQDLYGNFNTPMSQIVQQCDKAKLLMACRQVGQPNFKTLAMGPRVDVLHECGQDSTCTMVSNGVGWYYNDSWSWGFVPGGEIPNRFSCDVNNPGSDDRICWHSGNGNINGGYRCGSVNGLNGDNTWERVVFEAD